MEIAMRSRAAYTVGAFMLVVLVACDGGQTGDESTPRAPDASRPRDGGGAGDDFIDAIRRGFGTFDYNPAASIDQLGEWSDLVVVGKLTDVRPGAMRYRNDAGLIDGDNTAVLEITVSDTLKGEPAEQIYFWVYTDLVEDGPTLPDPPPDNRWLLFLRRVPEDDDDAGIDDISAASRGGVPDGEALHFVTTPQGMLVETESGEITLNEPISDVVATESFDALIERVRDELN
jgi:hypothetical protein